MRPKAAWIALAVLAVASLSWGNARPQADPARARLARLEAEARSGRLQAAADREAARRQAHGPQSLEADALSGTPRRVLPRSGRDQITVGYGDGAFYFYDRAVLRDFRDGRPWTQSLIRAQALAGLSGSALGVITVLTCCELGEAPIRIRRLSHRPPVRLRGWDSVAEHDLDLPTGDLVFQPNGDGHADLVVRMPADRYRVRVSERLGVDGAVRRGERYELDLWPRGAAGGSVVLAGPGTRR
jgi:hypothetical protein